MMRYTTGEEVQVGDTVHRPYYEKQGEGDTSEIVLVMLPATVTELRPDVPDVVVKGERIIGIAFELVEDLEFLRHADPLETYQKARQARVQQDYKEACETFLPGTVVEFRYCGSIRLGVIRDNVRAVEAEERGKNVYLEILSQGQGLDICPSEIVAIRKLQDLKQCPGYAYLCEMSQGCREKPVRG